MHIRISLNLMHYFQDYRQLSRICIKSDTKTIKDLKKHIVETFNIDKKFYLMCQNHFLPPTEDIHILNDNDTIYVIPKIQSEIPIEIPIIQSKKKKYKIKSNNDIAVIAVQEKEVKTVKTNELKMDVVENFDKSNDLSKKSEETKSDSNKIIVQNIEILNQDQQIDCNQQITETHKNLQLNDVINFNELNESEQNKSVPTYKSNKQYTGVGIVLKLLNSESSFNENSDTTEDHDKFVTKRRRVRARKRKHKNDELSSQSILDDHIFVPPKTIAAPKTHIKFNSNENLEGSFLHSTPVREDRNFNKIDKINPLNFPQITELVQTNNVILFKKLKIGANYTPEISNYILAKIKEVSAQGDQLKLEVLDGHNELKDPNGRFSCNLDEDEEELEDNTVIIEKKSLIDARLIN